MRNTLRQQDEDRRRIARQLHDPVAQHLAALQINLSLIADSQPVLAPRAAQALNDSLELTQALAKELREIASALYPPLLDQFGLTAALEACAQRFSQRTGVPVDLDLPPQLEPLPLPVEVGLFRIVEEAFASAGDGKSAFLRLSRKPKSLVLEFSGSAATPIIRERAKILGARLTVKRQPRNARFQLVLPR